MTTEVVVLPRLEDLPRRTSSWRTWSTFRRTGSEQFERQGVFTAGGAPAGSELVALAPTDATLFVDFSTPVQQDDVTGRVVAAALDGPGRTAAVGDQPVFVNVTRAYLVGDRQLPGRPDRLVIEVVEPITVDDAVIAGVRRLRAAGFRIALHDFVGLAGQRRLLPYADFALIDARDLDVEGEPLLTLARSRGARLVAQHVDTELLHHECRVAGFELYQGDALERCARQAERPGCTHNAVADATLSTARSTAKTGSRPPPLTSASA